jgi:hypothetical protein
LPPPWTIEIGDDSQIAQATFGPGALDPFEIEPLLSPTLGSGFAPLVVPIVRKPGYPTGSSARGTFTASNGSAFKGFADLEDVKPPTPMPNFSISLRDPSNEFVHHGAARSSR